MVEGWMRSLFCSLGLTIFNLQTVTYIHNNTTITIISPPHPIKISHQTISTVDSLSSKCTQTQYFSLNSLIFKVITTYCSLLSYFLLFQIILFFCRLIHTSSFAFNGRDEVILLKPLLDMIWPRFVRQQLPQYPNKLSNFDFWMISIGLTPKNTPPYSPKLVTFSLITVQGSSSFSIAAKGMVSCENFILLSFLPSQTRYSSLLRQRLNLFCSDGLFFMKDASDRLKMILESFFSNAQRRSIQPLIAQTAITLLLTLALAILFFMLFILKEGYYRLGYWMDVNLSIYARVYLVEEQSKLLISLFLISQQCWVQNDDFTSVICLNASILILLNSLIIYNQNLIIQ